MQAWVDTDETGRQFLVRTGTGVVTAVVPIGMEGTDGQHSLYRVEIYCDAPHGRPGAIRYSAHPQVVAGDPLHQAALAALEEIWPVSWTIQWHRHDWVPADLAITSLNLASDACSILTALDRVLVPEPAEMVVPDFIPVLWQQDRP